MGVTCRQEATAVPQIPANLVQFPGGPVPTVPQPSLQAARTSMDAASGSVAHTANRAQGNQALASAPPSLIANPKQSKQIRQSGSPRFKLLTRRWALPLAAPRSRCLPTPTLSMSHRHSTLPSARLGNPRWVWKRLGNGYARDSIILSEPRQATCWTGTTYFVASCSSTTTTVSSLRAGTARRSSSSTLWWRTGREVCRQGGSKATMSSSGRSTSVSCPVTTGRCTSTRRPCGNSSTPRAL